MEEKEQEQILKLYPEFKKVYGPYLGKDGRRRVVLHDGKKQSSRQLAKVRLEVKLNRRLVVGETVDHVDENSSNDDPSNLQPLSLNDNAAKSQRSSGRYIVSDHDQYCIVCQNPFRDMSLRQTCKRSECKSANRSRISKELNLAPPRNESHLNEMQKIEIGRLGSEGMSSRKIADKVGVNETTALKYRNYKG